VQLSKFVLFKALMTSKSLDTKGVESKHLEVSLHGGKAADHMRKSSNTAA